jgi:hypothetical protein
MSDNPHVQYANAKLRHKKQKSQGFHSDAKHAEREMIRISNLHKIKTGKHINDHAEKLVAHHEKAKEIKRQYVQHSTDLIHAKKAGDKERMERAAKGKAQAEKDHLAHTGEPAEEKFVEYKRPIREGKQMKTFKELYEACCSACEKRDEMEESDSGLAAKADKSGVSIGTLRKVYKRGVAAWNSGHRPGTTPQQWGMARVNSYITKGKGTYHGADKDLREAIQWTKPKNDEHDEVHTQLDAVKRGAEYPDHVHKMLKHLSNKSNFQGAMKNAKPMTITHKDTQPGGKHAEMSNTEATESKPKLGGLDQTKVRRVKKIFNNAIKHGKPMERPIVLHDTHTGHTHLLAGNTRLTHNTHYGSGSTEVHAIKYDSSKMHEEVARDKESGLPKKYVSGLSPSTAKARAAHWEKMDKLSDKDPAAYEPAPGDATAKTKESKHTKKARKMFGEACWTGYKKVGMKKKGDKMVPNCVPANEESDRNQRLRDALEKVKKDFTKSSADKKTTIKMPPPAPKPEPTSVGGGMDYYPKAAPGKRYMGDSVEMNGKKIEETQKGKNVVPPPAGTIATTGGIQEEENENKPLGKVMRAGDGKKKFKVFVRNEKGNVVKVGFGDPNMEIKRDDPERRKNFRARHNCDTATDRTTPRYWSCRNWRASAKVEA